MRSAHPAAAPCTLGRILDRRDGGFLLLVRVGLTDLRPCSNDA